MTQSPLVEAAEFDIPSRRAWEEDVESVLKGKPVDRLTRATEDGIPVLPLYRVENAPSTPTGEPGQAPFTRGATTARTGWGIRQAHTHPDLAVTNNRILHDLERGVTELLLVADHATAAGRHLDEPDAPVGEGGIPLAGLDDLDRVLDDVLLDLAPVHLDAGAAFLPLAGALMALWERRNVSPDEARGGFGADPVGVLARHGRLPADPDTVLGWGAELAREASQRYPHVTAFAVDTTPYDLAGATDAQQLACAIASGVAQLRAMDAAGLAIDDAARQIEFRLQVGTDQFAAISLLRAARRLWARVVEASGGSEPAQAMRLHVETSARVITARDPWVNLLRSTVGVFSAAVAGADGITVRPFTSAIGLPSELAMRMARNTQLILMEESNLGRVSDPAGGSWYVEDRTERLALEAWQQLQQIEADGGIVAVLRDGSLAEQLAESHAERTTQIAHRKAPITGVSEFPDVHEDPVATADVDLQAVRSAAAQRIAEAERGVAISSAELVASVRTAAAEGATVGVLADGLHGEPAVVNPLPRHRFAEDYEALRDAADSAATETGHRPAVFLANLGPIAEHTARATFAANALAAGGIEPLTNDGFSTASEAAAAFSDSGARIACLCSSDARYREQAVEVAAALRDAGAEHVLVAGRPEDPYADAVDDAIHVGVDLLRALRRIHRVLGLTTPDGVADQTEGSDR